MKKNKLKSALKCCIELLSYTNGNPKIPLFRLNSVLLFKLSNNRLLRIERGFITDFNSVPAWLWSFLAPIDIRSRRAAVVHDYLYVNRIEICTLWGIDGKDLRLFADQEYKRILIEDGYPKRKAVLHYYGVRVGGKKWFFN